MTSYRIALRRLNLLAWVFLMAGSVDLHAAAPALESITPDRGPVGGGTSVIIAGQGLSGTTAVTFGNTAAVFVVNDDSRITATAPAHAAGAVAVVVTNPDGSDTFVDGFSYGNVPTTVDDTYSTPFDTALVVAAPGILANDVSNGGGDLAVNLLSFPTNGHLDIRGDGSFTYTPNPGFLGTDRFTYQALNNEGRANLATVDITIAIPTTAQPARALFAAAVDGNRVTLRWMPPPVGPAVTDYEIEGGVNPGDVLDRLRTGSANPIFTFTAPTGAFYLRVRTIAGDSRSGPSNEIRVFVNTAALPSPPENLLAVVNGTQLGLVWRNTFTGGAPTSIVLDVTGSIASSIPLGLVDGFSVGGVPAGTYTLSLRAVNATGTSASSDAVTLTFPGPCSGPPLTPANFLAYKTGAIITVIWDPAASGAAPTSYVLNVSGSFVGAIPTTSRTFSATAPAGSFNLSVTAVNVCGVSAPTDSQTIVIP
jgi:hypothetical protein